MSTSTERRVQQIARSCPGCATNNQAADCRWRCTPWSAHRPEIAEPVEIRGRPAQGNATKREEAVAAKYSHRTRQRSVALNFITEGTKGCSVLVSAWDAQGLDS